MKRLSQSRILIAATALLVGAACSEEGSGGPGLPDGGDLSDGADLSDGGDLSDSGDLSDDVDRSDSAGEALLGDISVFENPSNALSFFVDWETTRPARATLGVDCGEVLCL